MLKSRVKTVNGDKNITAYSWNETPLPILNFKPLQRNRKIINYATNYMTLDTETSHVSNNQAWVYQWAIKVKNNYVYGRKPSELIKFMERCAEHYELKHDKRIIVYIHNASYDLQYLKHYLKKYDPTINFFMIDNHTILICDVLGFRFVCSWKLTNLSLNLLSENYAKTYRKAVGEIDYNVTHYQDSKLSDNDWYYMFSDVASQYDGIRGFLDVQGYNYCFDAPFTSTGFVRNKCRKSAHKTDWRKEFTASQLSYEQYNLCRWAFMGGVCIASFKYAGQTIRSDKLRHVDFTSSYPARQCINYFPRGKPMEYGVVDSREELDELLNTYCCVFVLHMEEVHIKSGVTAPYIPSSKCVGLKNPVRLNGKVVYAKELTIAVTELDFKWIDKQYTAESIDVDKMIIFERGTIPQWLKDEVMEYFRYKCTLPKDSDLYMKSKNYLNAIYGMTATAIIRTIIEMSADLIGGKKEFKDIEEENKKQLAKYYRSYNSFMSYQFALYTTAWARDALFTMIQCVGYENFLYCDTDSVFYIETAENAEKMQKYRKYCIDEAIKAGAYVNNKYLGEPTDEEPIRAFRALHAKCYAMEELDGDEYKLKVVIAGIPKKSTKWIDGKPVVKTNSEELGHIDNLVDGFEFVHNGGTRCIYVEDTPHYETINGHVTEIASSAIIENITKVISDTMYSIQDGEFINMLQMAC